MNLAEKYVAGLKKAYYENGGEEQWDDFEKIVHGAEEADMERLQTLYPDLPDSLYQLLKIVDGTYY
ncbi:MAG: SMI1/KNR4 family protein, partial [Lachnospiraceae bacterium]|nr:SMI1/KNR4 family protein [Lachnospiraceae bacterium]